MFPDLHLHLAGPGPPPRILGGRLFLPAQWHSSLCWPRCAAELTAPWAGDSRPLWHTGFKEERDSAAPEQALACPPKAASQPATGRRAIWTSGTPLGPPQPQTARPCPRPDKNLFERELPTDPSGAIPSSCGWFSVPDGWKEGWLAWRPPLSLCHSQKHLQRVGAEVKHTHSAGRRLGTYSWAAPLPERWPLRTQDKF